MCSRAAHVVPSCEGVSEPGKGVSHTMPDRACRDTSGSLAGTRLMAAEEGEEGSWEDGTRQETVSQSVLSRTVCQAWSAPSEEPRLSPPGCSLAGLGPLSSFLPLAGWCGAWPA